MTPCTQHAAHTAGAATDYPHSEAEPGSFGVFVTDRQTDTANIGKNSLYLMHSVQPNNKYIHTAH